MIAAHRGNASAFEQFHGFPRPQRTGHAVAEIDDGVGAFAGDIVQHRFQRGEVGVNVGDDGEAHPELLRGHFRSLTRARLGWRAGAWVEPPPFVTTAAALPAPASASPSPPVPYRLLGAAAGHMLMPAGARSFTAA